MKKIIVATAAALLAVGAQAATYKDGSYTGEGKGPRIRDHRSGRR